MYVHAYMCIWVCVCVVFAISSLMSTDTNTEKLQGTRGHGSAHAGAREKDLLEQIQKMDVEMEQVGNAFFAWMLDKEYPLHHPAQSTHHQIHTWRPCPSDHSTKKIPGLGEEGRGKQTALPPKNLVPDDQKLLPL